MIVTIKIKYRQIFGYVMFLISILFIIYFVQKFVNKKNCRNTEPIDVVYTWVNGSDQKFLNDLSDYQFNNRFKKITYNPSRYCDRQELRFSLRSLEINAPWIRNIYIVTNGQIPYWLNLDHEKINIVTHEDIFLRKDDLPTFSSPAIESHIHRIPGLSKKFIYFNDDIYLGAPVDLEDFYTENRGFLLYMDYPMGNCNLDCPWLFVNNGVCNNECNVYNCQYDGGDCSFDNATSKSDVTTKKKDPTRKNNRKSLSYLHNRNTTQNKTLSPIIGNKINNTLNQTNLNDTNTNNSSQTNQRNITLKELLLKSNSTDIKTLVDRHNLLILNAQRNNKIKHKRQHFDAYYESLQHTNRNLNSKYGYHPRYVPSHMPFLIDVDIMNDLQAKFDREFEVTSSNRFRSKSDMQYAFTYYYYIRHESRQVTIEEIFDDFDTDKSGTWSDREIRTILTKLYELPLSIENINELDSIITNCTKKFKYWRPSEVPMFERYVDSELPVISKDLILKCHEIRGKLVLKFGEKFKYKYEIVKNPKDYVTFQMINDNIKHSVSAFDKIRNKPTKFVCLNDNIRGSKNSTVNSIWYDFYVSIFPKKSQFELPENFRNHFEYVRDLRRYQLKITIVMYSCVLFTVYLILFGLCKKKCLHIIKNKLFCS